MPVRAAPIRYRPLPRLPVGARTHVFEAPGVARRFRALQNEQCMRRLIAGIFIACDGVIPSGEPTDLLIVLLDCELGRLDGPWRLSKLWRVEEPDYQPVASFAVF